MADRRETEQLLHGLYAARSRGDLEGVCGAFARDVKPGDRILLADGAVELRAVACDETSVRTEVVTGGVIGDHKGINLPGANDLNYPTRLPVRR